MASSKIILKRYEIEKWLGEGSFGVVYRARCLKTDKKVAIKILEKEKILKCHLEKQMLREITAMRLIKHPNVLELFEVMASEKYIYLVLSYARGGELFDMIKIGGLKEPAARRYFQQLICAVDHCHVRGVYHRDLKPENLLLDDKLNLKVADFGLSSVVDCRRKNDLLKTFCGTQAYTAPEVINRRDYDGAKADVWSCGVNLLVLLAGFNPFQHPNQETERKKITNAVFKCPKWFSSDVKNLIKRMLDPKPSSRISISEIKENRWFKQGLKDKMVEKPDYPIESSKIPYLNGFEIISLSAGLDLSNMFHDNVHKTVWFLKSSPAILSDLADVAKSFNFKVIQKKDGAALRITRYAKGAEVVLAIDAEIFRVTPNLHMVQIRMHTGDAFEYQNLLQEKIRPALEGLYSARQDHQ